eukprot:15473377-Alexandrium_andersonii.AAC.1
MVIRMRALVMATATVVIARPKWAQTRSLERLRRSFCACLRAEHEDCDENLPRVRPASSSHDCAI